MEERNGAITFVLDIDGGRGYSWPSQSTVPDSMAHFRTLGSPGGYDRLWQSTGKGQPMSFLSETIGNVERTVRDALIKFGVAQFSEGTLKLFDEALRFRLDCLARTGDLRIYDEKDAGGALRGPRSSRKQLEDRSSASDCTLYCRRDYLKHSHGAPSEVPYFRAVFNSGNGVLSFVKDGRRALVPLVAYEAPLMRKRTEAKNPVIVGRCVSCDLVAFDPHLNRFYCVEGKVDPLGDCTRLPYALLEAYAYGFCLSYHTVDSARLADLWKELDLCLRDFQGIQAPTGKSRPDVEYVVAAPRSYFRTYARARHAKYREMSKQVAQRRICEAGEIESRLRERAAPRFGGYLALPAECDDVREDERRRPRRDHDGNECIVPQFSKLSAEATLYSDLVSVLDASEDEHCR